MFFQWRFRLLLVSSCCEVVEQAAEHITNIRFDLRGKNSPVSGLAEIRHQKQAGANTHVRVKIVGSSFNTDSDRKRL